VLGSRSGRARERRHGAREHAYSERTRHEDGGPGLSIRLSGFGIVEPSQNFVEIFLEKEEADEVRKESFKSKLSRIAPVKEDVDSVKEAVRKMTWIRSRK
jgi:hypothetical protein